MPDSQQGSRVTPVAVVLDDGTVVQLTRDATGLSARHEDVTIFVSTTQSSRVARSPAKCRWALVERAVLA